MFLDIHKEKQFNLLTDTPNSISFLYLIQNNLNHSGTYNSIVLYPQIEKALEIEL